jgi:hypothetical protein
VCDRGRVSKVGGVAGSDLCRWTPSAQAATARALGMPDADTVWLSVNASRILTPNRWEHSGVIFARRRHLPTMIGDH